MGVWSAGSASNSTASAVRDTTTENVKVYYREANDGLEGIADRSAFSCSDAAAPDPEPEPEPDPEPEPEPACSDRTCLLQDGRFRVKAWYVLAGDAKSRAANTIDVDLGAPAGLFAFDAGEPELLVRITDRCAWNGHYAVYAAAGSDAVRYNVAVRDTETNELRWFRGRYGAVVMDSAAFPCTGAAH